MLAQYLVNKVTKQEAEVLLGELFSQDGFPIEDARVHFSRDIGFHIDLPDSLTERDAEHISRTFHANIKYLNEERQDS